MLKLLTSKYTLAIAMTSLTATTMVLPMDKNTCSKAADLAEEYERCSLRCNPSTCLQYLSCYKLGSKKAVKACYDQCKIKYETELKQLLKHSQGSPHN